MNNIDNLIENLNKEQKEAVLSTEGPNLIVAGAGSGKTKVLTSRIANIIKEKKAYPNQILCVTFTNKAAKEMQNRVIQNLKGSSNAIPWLGTFHSISVKLLLYIFLISSCSSNSFTQNRIRSPKSKAFKSLVLF